MTMLPIITLFVCALSAYGQLTADISQNLSYAIQSFSDGSITPNVIPSFTPVALMTLTYPNITLDQPGMSVTPDVIANQPFISLTFNSTVYQSSSFVTLIITPDSPSASNTSLGPVRMFLQADLHPTGTIVPGTLICLRNTSAPESEYLSPQAPSDGSASRIIVLTYIQPLSFDQITYGMLNSSVATNNWDYNAFAEMTQIGSPIAGTYFYASQSGTVTTGNATSSTSASASAATTSQASGASGMMSGTILESVVALAGISFVFLTSI